MASNFVSLTSARVLRKLKKLSVPKEGAVYTTNRNPRNLERLRIGYKPDGYHLEKAGKSFWHKLEVNLTKRSLTAEVKHFTNGSIVRASTGEWPIKKQLFKTTDTSACINLARVLAQRCQQAGITEMMCTMEVIPNGKLEKFLKTLQENGVTLEEPPRYKQPKPWDLTRPEKSWEILNEDLNILETTKQ